MAPAFFVLEYGSVSIRLNAECVTAAVAAAPKVEEVEAKSAIEEVKKEEKRSEDVISHLSKRQGSSLPFPVSGVDFAA